MVKRQNEVQLTKDNYDQDQDQQPSDDEETDHGAPFARASEQVLAQRKIYRARRPTETTSISASTATGNNNNNNPFASIALTAPSVSTTSTAEAPMEENTKTAETAPVVAAETTTTATATESTSPKLFGAAATFVTGFGAATGTGFGSASLTSSSSAFGSGDFTGTGFFANTTTGVFGEAAAAAGSATATATTTTSTATGTTTTITTSSSNGNSAPNHGLAEAPAAATLFPEHYQREPDEEGETCVLVIKCKSWRRGVVPPATTDNDETTAAATISHPSVPPSTLSATATSSNPEPPPLSNETSTSTSTTAEGEATATMPISDEQQPTSNTTGSSTEPQEEWLELCKGGDLRVLRHNETLQPRLLHRVEETRRVCLNTVLSEICQVTQPSEKHVQIHNLEVHASKNLRLHLFKCRSVAEATSLKECIELGIRNYRTACLERRQQSTSPAKEEVVDTIHDEPKTNENEE